VESDGEIDLFEYVLQKIVLRHLTPHFLQAASRSFSITRIKPLAPDCAVLLSALAYVARRAGQKSNSRSNRAHNR